MKERLDYIDWAKGILIILAVIGHVWQAGPVHNCIYAFHMPAFFVISGMLMRHTKAYEKRYFRFLMDKIYAFGIPFLFFEALGVLTDIIRHGVTLNIKGYIYNTVSLLYNDKNMWFIVALFLIEAMFCAAKKLLKNDWAVGAFCLVMVALYFVFPLSKRSYVQTIKQCMHYMLFFATGFYAKPLFEKKKQALYGSCSADSGDCIRNLRKITGYDAFSRKRSICYQRLCRNLCGVAAGKICGNKRAITACESGGAKQYDNLWYAPYYLCGGWRNAGHYRLCYNTNFGRIYHAFRGIGCRTTYYLCNKSMATVFSGKAL